MLKRKNTPSINQAKRRHLVSSTLTTRNLLAFFLPAGIFMAVFLVFPLIKLFWDSFFNMGDRFVAPSFAGVGNYAKAFSSETFLHDLLNTMVYVVIAVGAETLLGLTLAVVLTHKFRGFKLIRTLILTPLMIAPLVAGLVWKFMLSGQFGIVNVLLMRLGIIHSADSILWLSNNHLALLSCILADIWLTTPFMMLMFLAGIQGVPNELYEAAMVSGANRWQIITQVIIPNIRPVIFSAVVIRTIDAARTFDIIWAMTHGGPEGSSELLSIHIYKMLQRYGDVGYASAVSVIFIILLVSIALIAQHHMNREANESDR